jgi:D-alanyl-D-alanine carboxypeptidase
MKVVAWRWSAVIALALPGPCPPGPRAAAAQGRPGPLAATIREYARQNAFSGTVLVHHRGRIAFRESFGLADRAWNVPVTNSTRFRIASITKLFTSALILQLMEQGRVALDAPIRTYLPDYPGDGGDRVTIHQLLNHTSGIENFDRVKSYEEAVAHGIRGVPAAPQLR